MDGVCASVESRVIVFHQRKHPRTYAHRYRGVEVSGGLTED